MFVLSKTELHKSIGVIDECMRAGEIVVITNRGEAIGVITPVIPPEVKKRIKVKNWSIPLSQLD